MWSPPPLPLFVLAVWLPLIVDSSELGLNDNNDISLSFGARKLEPAVSLDEALQNQLVLILDNNIELAEEIVLALNAFPDSKQSRVFATAYLNAPYPHITSDPILVDSDGERPFRVDIRTRLAQVHLNRQGYHARSRLNSMHAVLASYLDDLRDTFRYFVVPPAGRSAPALCVLVSSPAFLECCPTCCPRCPCLPDGTQQVHFERMGKTFTDETLRPPVNVAPTGGLNATDDWWRSLEDLYPHKSVYGEREDLLVRYLASQLALGRFSGSDHETYERWMRMLASLGEPVTRESYFAARRGSRERMSRDVNAMMDARTIMIKLFSHLTRWARRHYLGSESGDTKCTASRLLCMAPGNKCPPRSDAIQCTGCVSCSAWPCPRPADAEAPALLPPPPAPTNYTTLVEPDNELRQGSGTCGWAPLFKGKRYDLLTDETRFSRAPAPPFHRVISGQPQSYGEFPSYVFLMIDNQISCGGTLISDRHVLTAGHCISFGRHAKAGVPPSVIRVNMGEHVKWKRDRFEYEARVRRVCRAPNYWSDGHYALHDWAVLELAPPGLRFNEHVQTACLPRGKLVPPTRGAGANCWLAGFGITGFVNGIIGEDTGISPSIVQKVRLEQTSCRPWNVQPLDKSRVCFARPNMQRGGTCRGDSGGPVLCQDKGTQRWVVMGVVSYGTTSCDTRPGSPVIPNVFSDVLKQLADIEKCIKG